jgi:putative oxidoreductase
VRSRRLAEDYAQRFLMLPVFETNTEGNVMLSVTRYVDLPARFLMALIFILSGAGKVGAVTAMQGYMAAHGLPGMLLWPTIALEVVGGVFVLIGLWTRPVALVMAGFCLVTAFIFHTKFADPTQMVMFLKNMAMAGGFLLLAKDGAPGLSVDSVMAARR